jgi:hypothetical protein
VILGSLATFVIILILGSVVGFVLATIFALLGTAGAKEGSVASDPVGISLTLLLAFFLGGYVAGRTASRAGAKQGLLVVPLTLVGTMFLAVVGIILGSGLINVLSDVRFPSTLEDLRNLGAMMPVFGVFALILPFVGGAVGGVRGATMGRKRRP